jgi:hypothetical protein
MKTANIFVSEGMPIVYCKKNKSPIHSKYAVNQKLDKRRNKFSRLYVDRIYAIELRKYDTIDTDSLRSPLYLDVKLEVYSDDRLRMKLSTTDGVSIFPL